MKYFVMKARVLRSYFLLLVLVPAFYFWLNSYYGYQKVIPYSYHVRRIPFMNTTNKRTAESLQDSLLDFDKLFPAAGDLRKRYPGAFILGAGKCGTGALRRFLGLHPQIVMPVEEEMWFYDGSSFQKGEKWHLNHMPLSTSKQVTMETSPGYFHSGVAMKRILKANNTAKFIVILRDPIDRAISHYVHVITEAPHIKGAFNPKPDAQNFEKMAIRQNGDVNVLWDAISYGIYVDTLKVWLHNVPLKQFFIVDGNVFAKNPLPHLQKLEKFLGVRPFFEESHFVFNKTKEHYCIREKFNETTCLPDTKGRRHPQISESVIEKLKHYYKPYNEELFGILGMRFDWK